MVGRVLRHGVSLLDAERGRGGGARRRGRWRGRARKLRRHLARAVCVLNDFQDTGDESSR